MRRTATCVVLACACALTACIDRAPSAKPPPARSWHVKTSVVAGAMPDEYSVAGSVRSDSRVELSSRLQGYVSAMHVAEGDTVRRGQMLARIDPSEVAGALRQSSAVLASAQAAWEQAQADFAQYRTLHEKGFISDSEWRRVQLRHDTARESWHQAQASVDVARKQRDDADLRSPIDGLVVARHKRAGDLAAPGQPLLTLDSTHGLVFETFVPEGKTSRVAAGQTVRVQIEGHPAALSGHVTHVVAISEGQTRSHQVKIRLPEQAGLAPGQFGKAFIALGQRETPSIPKQALVERGGLEGVFAVDGEGKARFRWLRLGREWSASDGPRIEVAAGLQPGERVVLQPSAELREGDLIVAPAP